MSNQWRSIQLTAPFSLNHVLHLTSLFLLNLLFPNTKYWSALGSVLEYVFYWHSLTWWFHLNNGFKYDLYTEDYQTCIASLEFFPDTQIYISNCLTNIFTWMYNRHLKLHMSKTESWSPQSCSNHNLPNHSWWQLHLSGCLGQKSWSPPWCLSFIPYPIHEQMVLALFSKRILSPCIL